MKNLLKNRMALSTVVTTLIILVVSVLLAGVVTYFAINVTSTRVQEESLQVTRLHVYVPQDSSLKTEAGFLIINTGGRDVVINKITVRGQAATFTGAGGAHPVWFYSTTSAVTADFPYIDATKLGDADTPTKFKIDSNAAHDVAPSAASSDITLKSGYSLLIYIISPDSITINDIGLTVGITVFTSQAMYYQETNIQAYVPAA